MEPFKHKQKQNFCCCSSYPAETARPFMVVLATMPPPPSRIGLSHKNMAQIIQTINEFSPKLEIQLKQKKRYREGLHCRCNLKNSSFCTRENHKAKIFATYTIFECELSLLSRAPWNQQLSGEQTGSHQQAFKVIA